MLTRFELEAKQQREADKVVGTESSRQVYFYNKIKDALPDNDLKRCFEWIDKTENILIYVSRFILRILFYYY